MVARRSRLRGFVLALVIALACALIARAPEARATEPAAAVEIALVPASIRGATAPHAAAPELAAPTVAFDRWKGLSFGSYLAPAADFVTSDGGIDVVFHFHAGQMAERQMKESGLNAVFVSCGFGIGSGPYATAFASPERFGRMLDELVKNVESSTGKRGLHVRHLALASWSAGFAAVGKILGVDRYYAMVDSVVLNDSLHSQYLDPNPKAAAPRAVDLKMIRSFIRFAKDASEGKKAAMVITHSAIVPPDYASSTEATQALLTAIEVVATAVDEPASRKMTLTKRADIGNLHVRGFKGGGPKDHFEHLHLLGEALQAWVVPRWKREDRLVYTLAGEQL
ncbi:hypothetical protein BH11MYX4_BH11MYX4_61130 [soil metagenome]